MRRSPARYLAPIALAAVIAGTYLIVHAGLKKHATAQTQAPRRQRPRGKYARAKFYVVQPGDSLTSISRKTGISLATLESLNRNVDPNALQAAQRLRLRR
jgi:LysM repeat protein